MSSSTVCSHCMRSIRQHARPERFINTSFQRHTKPSIRFISSSTRSLQEKVPDTRPYTAPPPITTGTVTANVTAVPPEKVPKSEPPTQPKPTSAQPSTAQMQQHLNSRIGRGRVASLTDNLAIKLRETAKSTTESYITYGLTEAFFKSCAAQAPYTIPEDQRTRILTERGPPKTAEGEDIGIPEADTFWFTELGLQPTFSTWSQITYLHMYILTVRIRTLDNMKDFRDYQRYLIEHFSNAAEDKMALLHSMNARGIRNRYLKDLFIQWRGLLAAYDEGLVKGDAVLGAAVWRNLWKGKEDVDWEKVAVVVAYMRRAIHGLGTVPLNELTQNLEGGRKIWEEARRNVMNSVGKSKGMNEPL